MEITQDAFEGDLLHDCLPVTMVAKPLMEQGPRKLTRGVLIYAPRTNTQPIFVGGPRVTPNTDRGTAGLPIYPGESVTIPSADLGKVFVITTTNEGHRAHWIGV